MNPPAQVVIEVFEVLEVDGQVSGEPQSGEIVKLDR
jgi:hypothetical protein